MSVRYTVIKNNNAFGEQQCVAKVRSQGLAGLDQVVELMMLTATVAKPDVLGVIEGFFTAVEYLLADGKTISTPLAVFRPGIQGTFVDEADSYDPVRHQIHACVSAGSRLRRMMRTRVQVEKASLGELHPFPRRYCDIESGVGNDTLTPGGEGRVIGEELRFDYADPRQGIFFIAADGSEVRARRPARNMPGELIFIVPLLTPGVYTLEVRSLWGDKIRSGQLSEQLTVQ